MAVLNRLFFSFLFFLLTIFYWSIANLQCCVNLQRCVVYSKVIQLYIYIYICMYVCMYVCMYIFFFRVFSITGYYKTLNMVPCAIQQVLVLYLACLLEWWLWVVTFLPGRYQNFSLSKEQASPAPSPVAPSRHLLPGHTLHSLIPQTRSSPHHHSCCKTHSMCAISSESFHPFPVVCHLDAFFLSRA